MSDKAMPNHAFWHGKKVLLTGHTGFKGAWLAIWLARMGADVTGISLAPIANPNLFTLSRFKGENCFLDIREQTKLTGVVRSRAPDIVLHLAAQSLVRTSYNDPVATFQTNIIGTVNLLDSIRVTPSVRVVVVITTDKVYKNLEHAFPYRETDHLGGHDPYSASKAASELVIASYRDSFLRDQGVAVASARAGNVIGGGDWSVDRLLPDAVRAWQSNRPLSVRRPGATRPWQHVLEPLSAYLVLTERLWRDPDLADSYNFGPFSHEAASVRDVVEIANAAYGQGEVAYGEATEGPHEAGWLALETAKARQILGIQPRWRLDQAVSRAMSWYRSQHDGADARSLCEAEIADYETDA